MPDIVQKFHLSSFFLAHLTSAVQFGFITGTFLFAILTIADRFSPPLVFCTAAIAAAICNLGISMEGIDSATLLLFRFLTGFFLAGIYPVGMKIASDYYQKGLGKSLGFLVGALVLGTAFPHLLKSLTLNLPWKYVVFATSALCVLGGLIVGLLLPDGPYRKPAQKIRLAAFLSGFANKPFRAAAFGYFGHMWELYAFWAFVPVMLANWQKHNAALTLNTPFLSFLIIGSGSLACIVSGFISQFFGTKKVAAISLFLSGSCCILSPFFLLNSSAFAIVGFLFFWGLVVIADSPLFSTLVAQNAPEESRGASLTIVNCIGFSITIISIQLIYGLVNDGNARFIYTLLAIGPVIGLMALMGDRKAKS